jgi:hypothetical protein
MDALADASGYLTGTDYTVVILRGVKNVETHVG